MSETELPPLERPDRKPPGPPPATVRVYVDIPIGLYRILEGNLTSESIASFIIRLLVHFVTGRRGGNPIPDPEPRRIIPRPEARGRRIQPARRQPRPDLPPAPDPERLRNAPVTKIHDPVLAASFRAHIDARATIAEISARFKISTTTAINYKRALGYEVRDFVRRRA